MRVTKTQLREAAARVLEDLITDGPMAVPPVVGLKEFGRMMGFNGSTVYQLRSRGVLPAPTGLVSGNPTWKLPTVYAWAQRTDREIVWDPWGICASTGDAAPANATGGS
jgi:hypothetical protein